MKSEISHPRLGTIVVAKSRRARRICLSLRPHGELRLTLPWGCSIAEGVRFMESKVDWVESVRAKYALKYPVETIADGHRVGNRSVQFVEGGEGLAARVEQNRIVIHHPAGTVFADREVQQLAAHAIEKAMCLDARQKLPALTAEIAARHGFDCGKVTIRPSRSRWGSCSARNTLSLSCYVLTLPDHLQRFVILHELCHTVHRNHSAAFHTLLDSHVDGHEKEFAAQLRCCAINTTR